MISTATRCYYCLETKESVVGGILLFKYYSSNTKWSTLYNLCNIAYVLLFRFLIAFLFLYIVVLVIRLHLVFISSQLLLDSIYSPPISNCLWHHPVRRIHSVSFCVDSTFYPLIFRWLWSHPVTIQFLKLHPNITSCQKSLAWSFCFCLYIPNNILRK